MSIIIEQSNKLNQHIEKILNVAKSDGNLRQLEKKRFNIEETLELVRDNASLKFPHAHVTVSSNESGQIILADEFHFYNIAYNIVENAIKYGNGAPKVDIQVNVLPKAIELSYKDNGSGIPSSHLEYVFDRFYRVPRESKKEVEGFGIGLFYVKKICDLHHWKINIKNNPDEGITVTIIIPKKV